MESIPYNMITVNAAPAQLTKTDAGCRMHYTGGYMVGRYSGTFFIIKSVFLHYLLLSSPFSYMALLAGALALIAIGLARILPNWPRPLAFIIRLLTLLPLLIGLAGTAIIVHDTAYIAALETKSCITPSAEKYYDLQYGYSRLLLFIFPAIIGAMGSIFSILLAKFTRKKDS